MLGDLLDEAELASAITDGFVRRQVHPSMPLAILNYTERATYERAWTGVTRQCRGLIYDTRTGAVAARPFAKFFNYSEEPDIVLALDEPVTITDKLDGSMGALYRGDGRLLRDRHAGIVRQRAGAPRYCGVPSAVRGAIRAPGQRGMDLHLRDRLPRQPDCC
jgi:hypothetical protein